MSELITPSQKKLMLFSGRTHPELAEYIAVELGCDVSPTKIYDFANGEIFVRFEESVRGSDAFVIQSHAEPLNKAIMEQLIMVDALKRASAKRITVVIPFYDAEAAYLQWNNTYSRLRYGDERRYNFSLAGFNFLERKQVSVYIPPLSSELRTYLKYDWENGGPSSPGVTLISSTPVSTTTSSPSGAEVLVCRAGVVPATFTHLNEFHNNAVDDVGAQFATLSATDQTAPVLVAPGYAGPVGTNGNEGSAPVLIGWI